MMKKCSICKEDKEISEFHKNKKHKDGLQYKCKLCQNEYDKKKWQQMVEAGVNKNPKYRQRLENDRLRRLYGITLEKYEEMFQSQKGLCKICKKTYAKSLCVDHCKNSGKTRGLLCFYCNAGLGFFKDDYSLLVKASKYLVPSRNHK